MNHILLDDEPLAPKDLREAPTEVAPDRSLAIVQKRLVRDSYRYLSGEPDAVNSCRHDSMSAAQYAYNRTADAVYTEAQTLP